MIYEFYCRQGHTTEAMCSMGTQLYECATCHEPAERILSPTRTTFVFADTRKRIRHIEKIARKE
jgi:hypothetical protein